MRQKYIIRFISFILIICFVSYDVVWAYPVTDRPRPHLLAQETLLGSPNKRVSFGRVLTCWLAKGGLDIFKYFSLAASEDRIKDIEDEIVSKELESAFEYARRTVTPFNGSQYGQAIFRYGNHVVRCYDPEMEKVKKAPFPHADFRLLQEFKPHEYLHFQILELKTKAKDEPEEPEAGIPEARIPHFTVINKNKDILFYYLREIRKINLELLRLSVERARLQREIKKGADGETQEKLDKCLKRLDALKDELMKSMSRLSSPTYPLDITGGRNYREEAREKIWRTLELMDERNEPAACASLCAVGRLLAEELECLAKSGRKKRQKKKAWFDVKKRIHKVLQGQYVIHKIDGDIKVPVKERGVHVSELALQAIRSCDRQFEGILNERDQILSLVGRITRSKDEKMEAVLKEVEDFTRDKIAPEKDIAHEAAVLARELFQLGEYSSMNEIVSVIKSLLEARRASLEGQVDGISDGRLKDLRHYIHRRNSYQIWKTDKILEMLDAGKIEKVRGWIYGMIRDRKMKEPEFYGMDKVLWQAQNNLGKKDDIVKRNINIVKEKATLVELLNSFMEDFRDEYVDARMTGQGPECIDHIFITNFNQYLKFARENNIGRGSPRLLRALFYNAAFVSMHISDPQKPSKKKDNPVFRAFLHLIRALEINNISVLTKSIGRQKKRYPRFHEKLQEFDDAGLPDADSLDTKQYEELLKTISQDFALTPEQEQDFLEGARDRSVLNEDAPENPGPKGNPGTLESVAEIEKPVRVISQDFKCKVEVVEISGKLYVKKSAGKILGLKILGRWLMKRQFEVIKELQGIHGIPVLSGDFDPENNAFYYEFIEGETLDKAKIIPDDYFDDLVKVIQGMWEKGSAHGDLGNRRNILVGDDGHPYILDFEQAIVRKDNIFSRWLFGTIKKEDLYHLYKQKLRYKPELTTEEEKRIGTHSSLLRTVFTAVYVNPRNAISKVVRRWKKHRTIPEANPGEIEYPTIYEVNARALKKKFSQITDAELEALKAYGVEILWFMGVWEESDYSRRLNEYYNRNDGQTRIPSAHSIKDYKINERLGGEKEFRELVSRANKLDLTVMLEVVPNNMAIDAAVVEEHPEFFMRPPQDLINRERPWLELKPENEVGPIFRHPVSGEVFYFGKAPGTHRWGDTVQLDITDPGARKFMKEMILKTADLTGGGALRIDMAYLTFRDYIKKNWFKHLSDEDFNKLYPEEEEFWKDVIGELRRKYPDIVLLAECYEGFGQRIFEMGFDFYYENYFRNLLLERNIRELKDFLDRISTSGRFNFIKFLESHDIRDRIKSVLGKEAALAAAALLYTLLGASLIYHDQEKGRQTWSPNASFIDGPEEEDDEEVIGFYKKLGRTASSDIFRKGDFKLLATAGDVVAFERSYKGESVIVAVNYSDKSADIEVNIDDRILKLSLPAWGYEIKELSEDSPGENNPGKNNPGANNPSSLLGDFKNLERQGVRAVIAGIDLADFSSDKELLDHLKRYCVIQDEGKIRDLVKKRLKAKEEVLFKAVFHPRLGLEERKVKSGSPLKIVHVRGGRGAAEITKELSLLARQGLVDLSIIPGAIDDGGSLKDLALHLNATGVPDMGKCSSNMGMDKAAVELVDARLIDVKVVKSYTEEGAYLLLEKVIEAFKKVSSIEAFLKVLSGESYTSGNEQIQILVDKFKVLRPDKQAEIIKYLEKFRDIVRVEREVKKHEIDISKIPMRTAIIIGAKEVYEEWQKAIDNFGFLVDSIGKVILPTEERLHGMALLEDGTFLPTENTINELKKASEYFFFTVGPSSFASKEILLILILAAVWTRILSKEEKNLRGILSSELKSLMERLRSESADELKDLAGKELFKLIEEKEKRKEDVASFLNFIQDQLSYLGASSKIEVQNKAINAINEADVILYGPTDIESNIASAVIYEPMREAIRENTKAAKILISNSRDEKGEGIEPPGTTASSQLERLYRYLSHPQQYNADPTYRVIPPPAKSFIQYVIGRREIETYKDQNISDYIPFDMEEIRKMGVIPMGLDLEMRGFKYSPTRRRPGARYQRMKEGRYNSSLTIDALLSLYLMRGEGKLLEDLKVGPRTYDGLGKLIEPGSLNEGRIRLSPSAYEKMPDLSGVTEAETEEAWRMMKSIFQRVYEGVGQKWGIKPRDIQWFLVQSDDLSDGLFPTSVVYPNGFVAVNRNFVRYIAYLKKKKLHKKYPLRENLKPERKTDLLRSIVYSVFLHEVTGHFYKDEKDGVKYQSDETVAQPLRGHRWRFINIESMLFYWLCLAEGNEGDKLFARTVEFIFAPENAAILSGLKESQIRNLPGILRKISDDTRGRRPARDDYRLLVKRDTDRARGYIQDGIYWNGIVTNTINMVMEKVDGMSEMSVPTSFDYFQNVPWNVFTVELEGRVYTILVLSHGLEDHPMLAQIRKAGLKEIDIREKNPIEVRDLRTGDKNVLEYRVFAGRAGAFPSYNEGGREPDEQAVSLANREIFRKLDGETIQDNEGISYRLEAKEGVPLGVFIYVEEGEMAREQAGFVYLQAVDDGKTVHINNISIKFQRNGIFSAFLEKLGGIMPSENTLTWLIGEEKLKATLGDLYEEFGMDSDNFLLGYEPHKYGLGNALFQAGFEEQKIEVTVMEGKPSFTIIATKAKTVQDEITEIREYYDTYRVSKVAYEMRRLEIPQGYLFAESKTGTLTGICEFFLKGGNKKVLDMGSGNAWPVAVFSKYASHVMGIEEISRLFKAGKRSIDELVEKNLVDKSRITLEAGNFLDNRFDFSEYDMIYLYWPYKIENAKKYELLIEEKLLGPKGLKSDAVFVLNSNGYMIGFKNLERVDIPYEEYGIPEDVIAYRIPQLTREGVLKGLHRKIIYDKAGRPYQLENKEGSPFVHIYHYNNRKSWAPLGEIILEVLPDGKTVHIRHAQIDPMFEGRGMYTAFLQELSRIMSPGDILIGTVAGGKNSSDLQKIYDIHGIDEEGFLKGYEPAKCKLGHIRLKAGFTDQKVKVTLEKKGPEFQIIATKGETIREEIREIRPTAPSEYLRPRNVDVEKVKGAAYDLVNMLRTASQRIPSERNIGIFIDEELAGGKVDEIRKAIESLARSSDPRLREWMENVVIFSGKMNESKLEQFEKRKRVAKNDMIIITHDKGLPCLKPFLGKSLIAEVDDEDLQEDAYYPLVEIVRFSHALMEVLDYKKEDLIRFYKSIPNAKDLDADEIIAKYWKKRTITIILNIPDAERVTAEPAHYDEIVRYLESNV